MESARKYDGTDMIVPLPPGGPFVTNGCCVYPGTDLGDPQDEDTGSPGDVPFNSNAKPSECGDEIDTLAAQVATQTCFNNPDAFVPNWLKLTEEEPYLNQRTCEYSIVMFADPPDCSEEYLNSFIPAAVDKLLKYYNKTEITPFTTPAGDEEFYNSKGALIDGVSGKTREGLSFVGTARVKTFYISPAL